MNIKFKEIHTKSNYLSLFRLLLAIPFFILIDHINEDFSYRIIIVALMAFGVFTDIADGWLARKYNEITEIGKIIDPLADKVAIGVIVIKLYLINEIPDFYGDRIVGKRNMTVRLGRERAILLYGLSHTLPFIFITLGVALNILPRFALLSLLCFPLAIRNFFIARNNITDPHNFIPAIRGAVLVYSITVILLAVSYL